MKSIEFEGARFFHRWSQKDQHEFTPAGQEDLGRWQQMITLREGPDIDTAEALMQWGSSVAGSYERIGTIIRTQFYPATDERGPECLIVGAFVQDAFAEAAFARIVLVDDGAVLFVYSSRTYGADATEQIQQWLIDHGAATERAVMAWTAFPSVSWLTQLPQAPEITLQ